MNQVVMTGLRLLEKGEYESETKRNNRIKTIHHSLKIEENTSS